MRFWFEWISQLSFKLIVCSSSAVDFVILFSFYSVKVHNEVLWLLSRKGSCILWRKWHRVSPLFVIAFRFLLFYLWLFSWHDSYIINFEFCVINVCLVFWRSCSRCGKVLEFSYLSSEASFVKTRSGEVCFSFLFFDVLFAFLLNVNGVAN
jgi:hypothetical protein